jgi:SAM-dependent methyltransferase
MEGSPIRLVDYAVHIHYLKEYLRGNERILEVGSGAGRFTKELAEIVGRIVVSDISPEKLQRNRRNAEADGYVGAIEEWRECDMCDLKPHFADGTFDAVVCYGGPLSNVSGDRFKAIRELMRVTKPGGMLFLSAKSLWGTVHEHLPSILRVDPRMNREIVTTGDLGPDTVSLASRFWHAYRADEFRSLIEDVGGEIVVMSASDCLSSTWADLLPTWRGHNKTWDHLLELEIEACRQPGCLDLGTHVLAVARRPA